MPNLCFLSLSELQFCNINIQTAMYSFKAAVDCANLLRIYTLKHCYDQSRVVQKSKTQAPTQIFSNCIIVRKQRVKNETDFGYKEELKTNILKKIHFVYLQSVQDLIAFLWKHTQIIDQLFGLLLIQNIEQYFGACFDYKECGPSFLVFIKLIKMLNTKLKGKGRVCISYLYNPHIFNKSQYEEIIRDEDCLDWQITHGVILKNGQKYESEQTKAFFINYQQKGTDNS